MSRKDTHWIQNYIKYTENTEASPLYNKWVGVSIIASVLQRKCFFKWDRNIIYPNLYIILVGHTTARKGTALEGVSTFLNEPRVNVHMSTDSTSVASFIRDIKASNEIYMDDEGKMNVHSSITVFTPELTTFIGDKNIQMLTILTDLYDTYKNPWTHKTISGSAQEITGVWLNLIGATTPELLQSSLSELAISGGFLGRTLLIYAPGRHKKVAITAETPEEIALKEILHFNLLKISELSGQFKITQGCLDAYVNWYNNVFDDEEECKDERFAGYFGRKATTIKKLLLILSAARMSDKIANETDFYMAVEMLTEMEKTMYRALRGVGKNQNAGIMERMMLEIYRRKNTTSSYLLTRFRNDIQKWELDNFLTSLEHMGFCTVVNGKIVRYVETFGYEE